MNSIEDLQVSLVAILDQNDDFKGSGFVIRSDGYIVTCHHVIFKLNAIKVKYRGSVYDAEWDEGLSKPDKDIAILKVENCFEWSTKIIYEPKEGCVCDLLGYVKNSNGSISCKSVMGGVVRKDVDVDVMATLGRYCEGAIKVYGNKWNSMPESGRMFKSYNVNRTVSIGFSGGLAISEDDWGVIGIIQSSKDNETRVIRWENMFDVFNSLNISIINIRQKDFLIPDYIINRGDLIKRIKGKIFDDVNK